MPHKAHTLEALQVHQRFDAWGDMRPGDHPGAAPPESFYLFSISAALLRALTGIQRRTATGPRAEQMAIQRRHDPKRSAEIGRYIRRGVMLSKSTSEGLSTASQDALLMPGYLDAVAAVRAYLDTAGISSGAVFRTFSLTGSLQANRIDGRDVARIVQRAAKGAGLAGDMGGHSLRAGFVTSAAKANVGIDRIAAVSRHKSPAILLGYVRRARVFEDAPQLAIT